MDVGVSPFPLLDLPNDALMHVLRSMKCFDLMGISILSERVKNLVKSMKLKSTTLRVAISNNVKIIIWFYNSAQISWEFDEDGNQAANKAPIKVDAMESVSLLTSGRQLEWISWTKTGIKMKDWIKHILTVTNHLNFDELFFHEGSDRFDIESVREHFDDAKCIYFDWSCSNIFSLSVLKTLSPVKHLYLNRTSFQDHQSIRQMLISQFEHIDCVFNSDQQSQWGLEELLIVNSFSIKLWNSNLSNKHYNLFIKHWMSGSNPRMKHLCTAFKPEWILVKAEILSGIAYQKIPDQEIRIFTVPFRNVYVPNVHKIIGGLDVQRNDGTKATIIVANNYFNFFVWQ